MVSEGYHDDAVSRAYYVVLHAAKAALLVHDIAAESHTSVRRLFGKHLILTGAIEPEWSKYLGGSLDDRLGRITISEPPSLPMKPYGTAGVPQSSWAGFDVIWPKTALPMPS